MTFDYRTAIIKAISESGYNPITYPTFAEIRTIHRPKNIDMRLSRMAEWITEIFRNRGIPFGMSLDDLSDDFLFRYYGDFIRLYRNNVYTTRGNNIFDTRPLEIYCLMDVGFKHDEYQYVLEFDTYDSKNNVYGCPDIRHVIKWCKENNITCVPFGFAYIMFMNKEDALLCKMGCT